MPPTKECTPHRTGLKAHPSITHVVIDQTALINCQSHYEAVEKWQPCLSKGRRNKASKIVIIILCRISLFKKNLTFFYIHRLANFIGRLPMTEEEWICDEEFTITNGLKCSSYKSSFLVATIAYPGSRHFGFPTARVQVHDWPGRRCIDSLTGSGDIANLVVHTFYK